MRTHNYAADMDRRVRWLLVLVGVAVLAAIVIAGTDRGTADNGLLGRWGIKGDR